MSTVQEIEAAIPRLPRQDIERLWDWIHDYLDVTSELTDDVKAQLNQSRSEIEAGRITTPTAKRQIWSQTFSRVFDALPEPLRELVQLKIDEMGQELETFPHKGYQGRSERRLCVGPLRVLYEVDIERGCVYLHFVGYRRELYH